MMRLGRTATLLVAFSLLTSAAMAYAECGWVVSSRNATKPTPRAWKSEGCPTLSKCLAKLREVAGEEGVRHENPLYGRRPNASGVLIRDSTTGALIELECVEICDCDGGP